MKPLTDDRREVGRADRRRRRASFTPMCRWGTMLGRVARCPTVRRAAPAATTSPFRTSSAGQPGVRRLEPAAVIDREEQPPSHRARERDRSRRRGEDGRAGVASRCRCHDAPRRTARSGGSNARDDRTGHGPGPGAGRATRRRREAPRRIEAASASGDTTSVACMARPYAGGRRPDRDRASRSTASRGCGHSTSVSCPRRPPTAFVWIWQTRDSVTPRISPISASVSPSK